MPEGADRLLRQSAGVAAESAVAAVRSRQCAAVVSQLSHTVWSRCGKAARRYKPESLT